MKLKNAILLMIFALAVVSCNEGAKKNDASSNGEKTVSIPAENLQVAEFTVTGMTCEGCENTVSTSVKKIAAVSEVSASFSEGKATVQFDKTLTNPKEIQSTIEAKGYQVEGFILK
jgi:copper chaperone CopZ